MTDSRDSALKYPETDRVAVVRQSLVDICEGNHAQAAVLNQLAYWTPRARDRDGWIFKSAVELTGELTGMYSRNTVRAALKALKDRGFLKSRNNPKHAWDRTLQYQVQTETVQAEIDARNVAMEMERDSTPGESSAMAPLPPNGTCINPELSLHLPDSGRPFVTVGAALPETTQESTGKENLYVPPSSSLKGSSSLRDSLSTDSLPCPSATDHGWFSSDGDYDPPINHLTGESDARNVTGKEPINLAANFPHATTPRNGKPTPPKKPDTSPASENTSKTIRNGSPHSENVDQVITLLKAKKMPWEGAQPKYALYLAYLHALGLAESHSMPATTRAGNPSTKPRYGQYLRESATAIGIATPDEFYRATLWLQGEYEKNGWTTPSPAKVVANLPRWRKSDPRAKPKPPNRALNPDFPPEHLRHRYCPSFWRCFFTPDWNDPLTEKLLASCLSRGKDPYDNFQTLTPYHPQSLYKLEREFTDETFHPPGYVYDPAEFARVRALAVPTA